MIGKQIIKLHEDTEVLSYNDCPSIQKLNGFILKYNKWLHLFKKPIKQGLIVQIYGNLATRDMVNEQEQRQYAIKCKSCNKVSIFLGFAVQTVFAPPVCPKCKHPNVKVCDPNKTIQTKMSFGRLKEVVESIQGHLEDFVEMVTSNMQIVFK